MAYRNDPDLEFLQNCNSKDLDILVSILIKDKDGSLRFTEELTGHKRYKNYQPDHSKYWDLIAAELQCFGGNGIATILRFGKGVQYRELLHDACDKMKVNYNRSASIENIEMNFLMKILTDSMEKMDHAQLKEMVDNLKLNTTDFSKHAVIAALQAGVNLSGFMAYQVALIVANAVAKTIAGRGLALAGNVALVRFIGAMAGPIGWALTGIWTLLDLSGPAYRVTIPSVVQVAFLRAQLKHKNI